MLMAAKSSPGPEDSDLRELFNLTIPADSEAIPPVTDAIAEALIRLEVPEQKRFEIGLATQEALANAIEHGCNSDPSKEVRCRCSCDLNGRILIVVTDPGPGFRFDSVSNPWVGPNLYADHGRGVYLIRQLMDDVQFEGGGNQVKMWKY
jgi:serine/threonine-protein kinase RsbW